MATIATQIIAALARSGVRRVYGLPGDSLNGFTDAIRRSGDITWEHVRHEETAAFAAAADAALTGRARGVRRQLRARQPAPDQRIVRRQRSRVPVLAIAAHIPRSEIGSDYFQETHPQDLFRECSVYCELVSTPEMAPRILEMAMRAAVEENGVAVVVVPGEIFLAQRADESGWLTRPIEPTRSVMRPDDESLRRAADLLNARRQRSPSSAAQAGGRPRRAGPAGRHAQRARRARAARQGVHRVRQPVRRRDDRPARLRLRLQGHQGGRRPADARHRLSLPAVLSRACARHPGRRPRPQSRQAHPDRPRPARHRRRHAGRAATPAGAEGLTAPTWTAR